MPKQTKNREKEEKKNLQIDVYDIKGKIVSKMNLNDEVFGVNVNPVLIAQAVRIYQANKRLGTRFTKTRSDVIGSTRKIYRQKGTGRARHGDIKAPIFVGGGVAHGPKQKDFTLSLPQKMKRKALFGVLTDKLKENHITVVQEIETVEPKTKNMQEILTNLHLFDKKKREKILLALSDNNEMVFRAGRNIECLTIAQAKQLNALDVLNHTHIIFTKDAMNTWYSKETKKEEKKNGNKTVKKEQKSEKRKPREKRVQSVVKEVKKKEVKKQ